MGVCEPPRRGGSPNYKYMIDLPNIRNITVSGRIASGTTTLAQGLASSLGWELLEGGVLFEHIHQELHLTEVQVGKRPDSFDLAYEERIKKMLKEKNHHIIQSHLAGFDAEGIEGIFKILILCEDEQGNDKTEIRIDRLANRRKISIEEAKQEILEREKNNLEKWRRMYAKGDENWVYWDKRYYDLVINTYSNNAEQTLKIALEAIGYNA